MSDFVLVTEEISGPAIVIHGGAGNYLETTTPTARQERGDRLLEVARAGLDALMSKGGAHGVLTAIDEMENDPRFNAGRGAKLQRDGKARVSAAFMNGSLMRLSSVYNAEGAEHPGRLAFALQDLRDRNLDGFGARLLMGQLGVQAADLYTERTLARWQKLLDDGEEGDREGAIGDSGVDGHNLAVDAGIVLPEDGVDPTRRYGTVGAVGRDESGHLWACTSTGGRGHEHPGRISDSPTPSGTYACDQIAISATGYGEQIIDLNLCGRIATRVIDGMSLRQALHRSFEEVVRIKGEIGVIAITADGSIGYAHSTAACGVAWASQSGSLHVDRHGRRERGA